MFVFFGLVLVEEGQPDDERQWFPEERAAADEAEQEAPRAPRGSTFC